MEGKESMHGNPPQYKTYYCKHVICKYDTVKSTKNCKGGKSTGNMAAGAKRFHTGINMHALSSRYKIAHAKTNSASTPTANIRARIPCIGLWERCHVTYDDFR